MSRVWVLAGACVLLLSIGVRTEDWPEFRGPGGHGHSSETGLPAGWSETRHVVWKSRVNGLGWSSPVVANGRVWLTSAVEDDGVSLRALAFEVASGRAIVDVEVFRLRRRAAINRKNSRATPTPVVDDSRVYVHFGAEGTAALTADGKVLWTARFPYQSQHGAGGSPIVHGDLLIFSCDGSDQAFVVALDKHTGKVRWKTNRRYPFDQAYTTPLVIRVAGRDQIVSVGAYRAAAYDPASGREIWRVNFDGFSNVPRPVFAHGLVYIATGFYQPTLLAVRPEGTGDLTRSQVVWKLSRGVPLTSSPLVVGDELYLVSDNGIATAIDAKTGAVHWQQRLGGAFSASPLYADGRIYFLSEEGVATAVAPGRTFRGLASSTLDGTTLSSMAVSGGSIFIRSNTHLYRIAAQS
jgi:outer membrane protein assembly factor BamB